MPIQVGKRVPVAINELEDVDAVAEAARGGHCNVDRYKTSLI
jgi:hypothetical protein